MNRQRIIFVDDEPNVLTSLRNVLRKHRAEWDMVFAGSGEAALAEMRRTRFDIIVSDVRMPGMDGIALLETVKAEFPDIIRVVLSGYANREAVLRAVAVAHQHISKPSDSETLRLLIGRACYVQRLLKNDSLRAVVGRLDRLPSLPKSYHKLLKAADDPDVPSTVIAGIVEQDAAVSAKLLQLVNSSYFGLAHRTSSIDEAVRYLGVELLKGMALSAHLFVAADATNPQLDWMEEHQNHSLLVAQLARRFLAGHARAEEAFTAGLLHDIGKLIILHVDPASFRQIRELTSTSQRNWRDAERQCLDACHAEIGAYLLCLWGLPFPIVEAVACHHRPSESTTEESQVLAALYAANEFSHWDSPETKDGEFPPQFDRAFIEKAGFAGQVSGWADTARRTPRAEHRNAPLQANAAVSR